MTFNNVDLATEFNDGIGYFIVNEVRGRGVMPAVVDALRIPGMDGVYTTNSYVPERFLEVDITLKGTTFEDLRRRVERLSAILHTKKDVPITFADESERTYFGRIENVSYRLEMSMIYKATLTIICGDPRKFGAEKSQTLLKNQFAFENAFGKSGNFYDDGTGNAVGWLKGQTVTYDFDNMTATLVNSGFIYRDISGLDVSTKYLLMLDYTSNYTEGAPIKLNKWDYGDFTGYEAKKELAPALEFTPVYCKFENLSQFRFSIGVHSGAPVQTTVVRRLRLYEISREVYDLIDVDPAYTGANLEEKYPFTEGKYFENIEDNPIVNYAGTARSSPVFKVNVLAPITNLDIVTDNAYIRLGEPPNVDDTIYNPKTTMLNDDASTTVGWGAGGFNVDDGQVSGAMTSDGQTFYASDYGVGGAAWRGPAIVKSFPNAELLQDFETKVMLMSRADRVGGIGRAEAYLLASDMSVIGKLSVSMPSERTSNLFTRIDVRGATGKQMLFDRNWRNEHYAFILELSRKGTLFTAKVGQVLDDGTTRHLGSEQFDDYENKYQTKLAAIGLHLGAFSTMPTLQYNRIHHTLVYRLNEDIGIPYIADEGDEIVIDCADSSIMLNGEDRKDLKDFGATFFDLKPGDNTFSIAPADAVNVEISYKETYL